MKLFTKKETIIKKTEQQRDAFIEKLENAHVVYEIIENKDDYYTRDLGYMFCIDAKDLKKVS